MADAMADINHILRLIAQEHVGSAKKQLHGNDLSMKVTYIRKPMPQIDVIK